MLATVIVRRDDVGRFMWDGFVFLSLAIALVVVCFIWLLLVLRLEKETRNYWGIIGSLVASLVLLLIQFPEHTPGLWAYGLKLAFVVWTGSFVLIVLGLDAGRVESAPMAQGVDHLWRIKHGFQCIGRVGFSLGSHHLGGRGVIPLDCFTCGPDFRA